MNIVFGTLSYLVMVFYVNRIFLRERKHLTPWLNGPDVPVLCFFAPFIWPVELYLLIRDEWTFGAGLHAGLAWLIGGTFTAICFVPSMDFGIVLLVFLGASIGFGIASAFLCLSFQRFAQRKPHKEHLL